MKLRIISESQLICDNKAKALLAQGHPEDVVEAAYNISKKHVAWFVKTHDWWYWDDETDPVANFIEAWANKFKIDLDSYSWNEALEATIAYETKTLSRDTVFDPGNGWSIVKVPEDEIETEGMIMQNCLKYMAYDDYVYSLRDPQNKPHVSIRMPPDTDYFEMQGKQNEYPKREYAEMVYRWIRKIKYPLPSGYHRECYK